MDAETLIKYLGDAVPQGPHPHPHAEWISVRLDVVQNAIDHIEWLEKGNAEWRDVAIVAMRHIRNLISSRTDASDRTAAEVWLSMFSPR